MNLVKDFNREEIEKSILNSSLESSIYIGCDSQVIKGKTDFVTVLIVHFDTKHGAKIFYQRHSEKRRMAMVERLWKEVELVANLAVEYAPMIEPRHLSVHLDLNPDKRHRSNTIIQEAVGYIRGLGFDVQVKPDAFASSHASDHLVKNKIK